jgi:outer membrane protein
LASCAGSPPDGYDAILEKQAVPYMRNDLDLTDRIIQMYNSGAAPASSGAPAAPPKAPAKQP